MKISRWSNAASSLIVSSRSMPLPETSRDMSPTPTTSNSHVAGVLAATARSVGDTRVLCSPGAGRGDAKGLGAVAGVSTRGECAPEPVAGFDRNRVGDIRERRRALVGGDHKIRIVAFVPHD